MPGRVFRIHQRDRSLARHGRYRQLGRHDCRLLPHKKHASTRVRQQASVTAESVPRSQGSGSRYGFGNPSDVLVGLSQGRFPSASRSHHRSFGPRTSSAFSLALAALTSSWRDDSPFSESGVFVSADADDQPRTMKATNRSIFIPVDSTVPPWCLIWFGHAFWGNPSARGHKVRCKFSTGYLNRSVAQESLVRSPWWRWASHSLSSPRQRRRAHRASARGAVRRGSMRSLPRRSPFVAELA